MLTVTTLNGQSEAISEYNGYEEYEEVNGAYTLTFTSFLTPQNVGHSLITEESIITTPDGDDFRVKQVVTNRTSKKVAAVHVYFDNVEKRKYDIYGGTRTFDEFMTWTLAGTGWNYRNVNVSGSVYIPNFGNDNVVRLVDGLLGAFECEMIIGPDKTLTFAKKIGPDNDAQYRHGHNVVALSESIDTTKLRTHIEGYGSNGLHVKYTSLNASIFGIRHAEPIRDDRYTQVESMSERLRRELIDTPEVSIELDAIELQERELGERVWLIYEPLGIEFQTRVMAKKKRYPRVKSTVTLGNSRPASQTDILTSTRVELDENRKETRSRIEQTNDRITLEVEEIDQSIAAISLQSDNITLSVQSLDNRVGSAESSISIQAGQISSKVERNGVISAFNQSPEAITLDARRINLVGAVNVLSDISGNMGTITAGNLDIYQDIKVGNGVYLRGSGDKRVQFSTSYIMELTNGDLDISSLHNVNIGTRSRFTGVVDFSSAIVTGLSVSHATNATNATYLGGYSSDGFAKAHTSGIGISYSQSAKRLYVSMNGLQVGFVNLT